MLLPAEWLKAYKDHAIATSCLASFAMTRWASAGRHSEPQAKNLFDRKRWWEYSKLTVLINVDPSALPQDDMLSVGNSSTVDAM